VTDIDPRRVKAGEIRSVLIAQASAAGPRGADPGDVARAIAGKDEKKWRRLMKPVKDEAVRLAKAGEAVILRKGKPHDPDRLRGLYRVRLLAEGETPPLFEKPAEEADPFEDFDDDGDDDAA
jgi:hypothetical protein